MIHFKKLNIHNKKLTTAKNVEIIDMNNQQIFVVLPLDPSSHFRPEIKIHFDEF